MGEKADELVGDTPVLSGPAANVLVRAAAATGAAVVLVHPGDEVSLTDGVGAVLRFPVGPAA